MTASQTEPAERLPGDDPLSRLRAGLTAAVAGLAPDADVSVSLEASPRPELGEYSTNAAMVLAKPLKTAPRDIAAQLVERIAAELPDAVERCEVAGPGFINLFLSDRWYRDTVKAAAGADGLPVPSVAVPQRTLVEFVSANPTGPLTAASGRHAAYGDAVASLLTAIGQPVEREYYVNDGGSQVARFGASIAARMRGEEPPEDGYHGDYVGELAERATAEGLDPDDEEGLALAGVGWMVNSIRSTLEAYGVKMDRFFSERSLYSDGLVEKGIERLEASGHTYRDDGALWLRTTAFGDDKDRVLVRSSGEVTYFGADIAYHADKIARGFRHLIDVLGADHHGYVARMTAAVRALAGDEVAFEVPIQQMIHLVEGGQRTKMSKRAGDIVTLDELLADVGRDAARWFLLERSHDRTIDLDLDLARERSSENPVFYVQYAHARIGSILRRAAEGTGNEGAGPDDGPDDPQDSGDTGLHRSEKELVQHLARFPDAVHEAAERRAPHRICAYATELAAGFHAFYRDCQVIGAEGDGVEQFRLELCEATAGTIRASLDLLGISAPERM